MSVEVWLDDLSAVPAETVILSGAGTSVDGPSCIPPGLGVTQRVLKEAAGLSDREIAELASLFEACGMPGGFPRFETVLGVVAETLGERGLRLMLRDIIAMQPNDLHEFFAQHLSAGGTHITANIDRGIELAGGSAAAVTHFHGVAQATGDLSLLGITLRNVEEGFAPEVEALLRAALLPPSSRGIVVVGYSGTDYFDMTPFLESLRTDHALSEKHVLWLEYDPSDPRLRVDESHLCSTSTTAETIRTLREAGAVVTVLRGSVRSALARLAAHWALPSGNLPDAPAVCAELMPVVLPAHRQAAVRVTLYERLGYLPGLEMEEALDPDSRARAGIYAMADWNRGRYRAAATKWQSWFVEDPDRRLLREERVVACNWVAGRYLRALVGLNGLLNDLEATPDASLATRLVIADTGARLWDHMRKLPDTRWLATGRLRRRILSSLPSEDEVSAAHLSPDLHDRLRVALTKIDSLSFSADEVDALHTQAFRRNSQTSSLVRTLNYLQGSVRQSASTTRDSRGDIARLWQNWRRLDAHGEAVRLLTIPAATHVVGLRRALLYVWTAPVDYSRYHRLRVLVLAAALHLRHRRSAALAE